MTEASWWGGKSQADVDGNGVIDAAELEQLFSALALKYKPQVRRLCLPHSCIGETPTPLARPTGAVATVGGPQGHLQDSSGKKGGLLVVSHS